MDVEGMPLLDATVTSDGKLWWPHTVAKDGSDIHFLSLQFGSKKRREEFEAKREEERRRKEAEKEAKREAKREEETKDL